MKRSGNSALRQFKQRLKTLPRSIAHNVAQRAAPELSRMTRSAFDAGRSVYGESRPLGVNGKPLDLRDTGQTADDIRFVSNGTVVRVVLAGRDKYGRAYQKYLIGKYGILPNGALPAAWSRRLGELVHETPGSLVK